MSKFRDSEHPRGGNGRFIDKNSGDTSAKNKIKDSILKIKGKSPTEVKKSLKVGESKIVKTSKGPLKITKILDIENKQPIEQAIGSSLKNYGVTISESSKKHANNDHQKSFDTFKNEIPNIINYPDMIFDAKKPKRILMIKKVSRRVRLVLEISTKSNAENRIVSMHEIRAVDVEKLKKNRKILYKK